MSDHVNAATFSSHNRWVRTAALIGGIGVALGAFGAHGLKDRVAPELLAVYKTGVLYHLLHAVALLALCLAGDKVNLGRAVRWFFTIGIVIFSGTLYVLALSGKTWLGAITPIGGLCFIIGWATLAVGGIRRQ